MRIAGNVLVTEQGKKRKYPLDTLRVISEVHLDNTGWTFTIRFPKSAAKRNGQPLTVGKGIKLLPIENESQVRNCYNTIKEYKANKKFTNQLKPICQHSNSTTGNP